MLKEARTKLTKIKEILFKPEEFHIGSPLEWRLIEVLLDKGIEEAEKRYRYYNDPRIFPLIVHNLFYVDLLQTYKPSEQEKKTIAAATAAWVLTARSRDFESENNSPFSRASNPEVENKLRSALRVIPSRITHHLRKLAYAETVERSIGLS